MTTAEQLDRSRAAQSRASLTPRPSNHHGVSAASCTGAVVARSLDPAAASTTGLVPSSTLMTDGDMASRRLNGEVEGIQAELADGGSGVRRGLRRPRRCLEDAGKLREESVRARVLEDIATDAQPCTAGLHHGAGQRKENSWLGQRTPREEDRHVRDEAVE